MSILFQDDFLWCHPIFPCYSEIQQHHVVLSHFLVYHCEDVLNQIFAYFGKIVGDKHMPPQLSVSNAGEDLSVCMIFVLY